MVQTDIDLLKYYRYFRYWWLLVISMLVGGAAGWIFHRVQPPVYDAQTSITVTIDYSQTGNLSAYNVDQAVGAIQGVFFASQVIQPLVQLAKIPSAEVFNVFKMERFGDVWILHVYHTDAQEAAKLVNLWAETGYQALVQAQGHAQRARILSRYLNNFMNCPPPPEYTPSVPPICLGSYTLNMEAVSTIQNLLQQESLQSNAINATLLFSLNAPAQPPEKPVIYQRNWSILAGTLVGFLGGILILGVLPLRMRSVQVPWAK